MPLPRFFPSLKGSVIASPGPASPKLSPWRLTASGTTAPAHASGPCSSFPAYNKRFRLLATGVLLAAGLLTLGACAPSLRERVKGAASPVTSWTLEADAYGNGGVNWHSIVIMHMAMHDAYNAARPTYARWFPPSPGEPPGAGASPEAAIAAAARTVLDAVHPERRRDTERLFRRAIAPIPEGPAKAAGIRLGNAVGLATMKQRDNDGFITLRYFATANGPGQWRPTPRLAQNSRTENTRPFLYRTAAEFPYQPPPALDSEAFRRDLEEVRKIGVGNGSTRTVAQTKAALFWARQSSQRGFAALAVDLLGTYKRPGGLAEEARIMSQLSVGLADSAIIIWYEKEKYAFWRPVTAIRAQVITNPGGADANWLPLAETPPFPEYPSGHASDCFVGAGILAGAIPDLKGPVYYESLSALANSQGRGSGMGYNTRLDGQEEDPIKPFPALAAAAEECYDSRVWAGVHFRSAEDEARRVASLITARALAAVPPLAARTTSVEAGPRVAGR